MQLLWPIGASLFAIASASPTQSSTTAVKGSAAGSCLTQTFTQFECDGTLVEHRDMLSYLRSDADPADPIEDASVMNNDPCCSWKRGPVYIGAGINRDVGYFIFTRAKNSKDVCAVTALANEETVCAAVEPSNLSAQKPGRHVYFQCFSHKFSRKHIIAQIKAPSQKVKKIGTAIIEADPSCVYAHGPMAINADDKGKSYYIYTRDETSTEPCAVQEVNAGVCSRHDVKA
ncbi:hypothetical protein BCR37DRAFT_395038 [Protomyces lactucae-debilis]|uniref:Uncharacterized protein n=1 Tax=Protomyces lactucae-debilis TaxID=2754530 RepID=A0A1Y2F388_PROLT|nr:uncharacterized protein BCR37DRAFT_395038 [Protomyces lactucae-debilis]ORY77425.1 hypothetical protein BCR37DRAFT_395038 [Protomyces lactucae-debilis]